MKPPDPTITFEVDLTNPGQFFACCGLLELADRLWPGAEGWFDDERKNFQIACDGELAELVGAIATAELVHARVDDAYASPVVIGRPFRPLTIDWWESDQTGARDFKVWAGTMESFGIARALQHALRNMPAFSSKIFDEGVVVSHPDAPEKKKEPFYFDSRRASNAHSRDVGFSVNDLGLTSIAHPAVELLCFVGLQVSRPQTTRIKRVYEYFPWTTPILPNMMLAFSTGAVRSKGTSGYRFENWFRTGQRKHKAFRPATSFEPGE